MSFFKKKHRTVDGLIPKFIWTRCRRCHSYECEVGKDLIIIDANKCTPSQGQWYDYNWEISIDCGESICGRRTYSEKQIGEAKFDAEYAYRKWMGE